MKRLTYKQIRAKKKRKDKRRRMLAKLGLKPTPRLPSIKSLKRRADRLFSLFIRKRFADAYGRVSCVTCQARLHWKKANAGHFIKRQFVATRYDARNCHVQCVHCNLYRGGELIEYNAFMLRTYGQQTIDELRQLKTMTVNRGREFYNEVIHAWERWEP